MNKRIFDLLALLIALTSFVWTVLLSLIYLGDRSPLFIAVVGAQSLMLLIPYQIVWVYFRSRIIKVRK